MKQHQQHEPLKQLANDNPLAAMETEYDPALRGVQQENLATKARERMELHPRS